MLAGLWFMTCWWIELMHWRIWYFCVLPWAAIAHVRRGMKCHVMLTVWCCAARRRFASMTHTETPQLMHGQNKPLRKLAFNTKRELGKYYHSTLIISNCAKNAAMVPWNIIDHQGAPMSIFYYGISSNQIRNEMWNMINFSSSVIFNKLMAADLIEINMVIWLWVLVHDDWNFPITRQCRQYLLYSIYDNTK